VPLSHEREREGEKKPEVAPNAVLPSSLFVSQSKLR
jgi:hypothetical protein